jgi:inosose dehydratase
MDRTMSIRLATGPVSWGVDFADAPGNPPWTDVLDGTVAAGYRWIELGPLGYLPERVAHALRSRGLGLTGGFVFRPLGDRAAFTETLALAERTAARVATLGGRFLTIIDLPSDRRPRAALAQAVEAIAAVTRAHGLQPLFHPHAGTAIETEEEVESLLEFADLCLDTGHALYLGQDPVALYERWATRIPYLHLKDLDPARVDGGFWSSVRAGAFRPLGEGALDLRALLGALSRHGFDGWCVVEQDRIPGGDPVADLVAGRQLVEALT